MKKALLIQILLTGISVGYTTGLLIRSVSPPSITVQGQIIVSLQTNTIDVMKSEVEKIETVKIEEVHSIRFEHENTLWEVPFKTRLISESVTNMVKQETWTPKLTVPPIPVITFQGGWITNENRSLPLPTRYGPQSPLPHPDIPR